MPVLAQTYIPINFTKDHKVEKIIINEFKSCACFNKDSIINKYDLDKENVIATLNALVNSGAVTCKGDICCKNNDAFESFISKLDGLK